MSTIPVVLPEGVNLKVNHLHQGNTSRSQRKGHPYITIARVINDRGEVVAEGKAWCSRKDSPSRSVGRSLAVSRALIGLYADHQ